jgi:hypothetical protein
LSRKGVLFGGMIFKEIKNEEVYKYKESYNKRYNFEYRIAFHNGVGI